MDFFQNCLTQEDAKATYRQLAKEFHPDKGGSPEQMKQLNDQYEKWTPPQAYQKYSYTNPFNDAYRRQTQSNPNNWWQQQAQTNYQQRHTSTTETELRAKIERLEISLKVERAANLYLSKSFTELQAKYQKEKEKFKNLKKKFQDMINAGDTTSVKKPRKRKAYSPTSKDTSHEKPR